MDNRRSQNASAVPATFAVMGVVALSVGAFFLFTMPRAKKVEDPDPEPEAVPGEVETDPGPSPGGGTTDVPGGVPEPPGPGPGSEPDDPRASPAVLVGEIARRLTAGDLDGAAELIGPDIGGGREALGAVFGEGGYAPALDEGRRRSA